MNNQAKKFILFFGDILFLYLSLYFALLIRYSGTLSQSVWQTHFFPFSFIFLAWIIIFYIFNLYNLNLASINSQLFRLSFRAIFLASLFSVTFFYFNPNIGIAPKTNLFIFIIILSATFTAWRLFFNWILRTHLPKNNIAFIGLNKQVEELIKEVNAKNYLGYRIAFVVDDGLCEKRDVENIPIICGYENLKDIIIKQNISSIILSSSPHQSAELRKILFECLPLKINYINLPHFYETITGRIPLEAINQMWFLENLSEGHKNMFDFFKRSYDIFLASVLFIISSPLWPLLAIIIKSESKGPIFFKQKRVGRNGQIFTMLKFRSMKEENNNLAMTIVNDSRITKSGIFMRKTRLDEIPQLINILKNEMSFVGPRPERPEFVEDLKINIPFYEERLLVKPGATGWDQVSGEYHSPSQEDTIKKLQYDLFYIKNRSIYLDLSIILKTIYTVLSSKGI